MRERQEERRQGLITLHLAKQGHGSWWNCKCKLAGRIRALDARIMFPHQPRKAR